MIQQVKRFYSRPFLNETRSPAEIILYRAFMAVVWLVYSIQYRATLGRTRSFLCDASAEIRRHGKSAFVFANGPSMSDIDLSKVRALCNTGAYDLIAINSYLSKSAEIAPPTFAVFADNVHFAGGETQYTKDVEACERLGIPYFAPAKYCAAPNPLRHGFCSIANIDASNTTDITRPTGYYGVTAFYALSLAKMLGYRRIYICGFDNSYFRDFEVGADGSMFIRHKHYYDEESGDTLVPCIYRSSAQFFFDTFRHFHFLEKIERENLSSIANIARTTFLSTFPRDTTLSVYKDVVSNKKQLKLCSDPTS